MNKSVVLNGDQEQKNEDFDVSDFLLECKKNAYIPIRYRLNI